MSTSDTPTPKPRNTQPRVNGKFVPGSPTDTLQQQYCSKLGGRPRNDMKKRFSRHDPAAEVCIVALMKSKQESIRLGAAREILDRAHGKPKQVISIEISEDDLNAEMDRIGLATRLILVPSLGESKAAELMTAIMRKYYDLRDGEERSDGD